MTPSSMLVARNVREDIATGFVAALFLATAVLVVYLATVGLPDDAADAVLSASPVAQPSRADAPAAADAAANEPVYRLPPLTVVGHRDDAAATIAGERRPVAAQETQASAGPGA